jgi:uncharacterized UPF0160 family protein
MSMLKRALSKVIGTHSGSFHADEALAIAILKRLPEWSDADVVRTRDLAKLATCDLVVDVGAEYDAARLRFDHHQRGFEQFFDGRTNTKLSSAGLVYKHFGRQVIAAHLQQSADESLVDLVYQRLYVSFIESVDALDNGVERFASDQPPRFELRTDLGARVARLNASWLEEDLGDDEIDRRFASAVALTGQEFVEQLDDVVKHWLPARNIVADAVNNRFAVDASGRIVRLARYAPWQSHIFDIAGTEEVLYVIYSESAQSDKCRIAAVPAAPGSFQSRKALPEPWRGLRDSELDAKTGVAGGVFVHANGFIGGANSYASALALAQKAIAHQQ